SSPSCRKRSSRPTTSPPRPSSPLPCWPSSTGTTTAPSRSTGSSPQPTWPGSSSGSALPQNPPACRKPPEHQMNLWVTHLGQGDYGFGAVVRAAVRAAAGRWWYRGRIVSGRAAAARRLGPVRGSDQHGDGSHSPAGERDSKQEQQVTRSIAASALFRGQCGSVTEVRVQPAKQLAVMRQQGDRGGA